MDKNQKITWRMGLGAYSLDKGNNVLETLESGCDFEDAQGNVVRRFYGIGGGWGRGHTGMGGSDMTSLVPAKLHLRYYDYAMGKFYQLEAALPTQKIAELFAQKEPDIWNASGGKTQRYDGLDVGIAPQGYIMAWAMGPGDRVELQDYRAQEIPGMTINSFNKGISSDFYKLLDRWDVLGGVGKYEKGGGVTKESFDQLKTGWTPPPIDYIQRRVKFPWRYKVVGNARLVEFQDIQGNEEYQFIWNQDLSLYNLVARMRGIPGAATFWFVDSDGDRHSLFITFKRGERVTGEPDYSSVRQAFEQIFGKRELADNAYAPGNEDMATLEIDVGPLLHGPNSQGYTATLVKGNKRVPLKITDSQINDLKPGKYF